MAAAFTTMDSNTRTLLEKLGLSRACIAELEKNDINGIEALRVLDEDDINSLNVSNIQKKLLKKALMDKKFHTVLEIDEQTKSWAEKEGLTVDSVNKLAENGYITKKAISLLTEEKVDALPILQGQKSLLKEIIGDLAVEEEKGAAREFQKLPDKITLPKFDKLELAKLIIESCGNEGTTNTPEQMHMRKLLHGCIDCYTQYEECIDWDNVTITVFDYNHRKIDLVTGNGENCIIVQLDGKDKVTFTVPKDTQQKIKDSKSTNRFRSVEYSGEKEPHYAAGQVKKNLLDLLKEKCVLL